MTHPADYDYAAANEPNEAELTGMLDSALALAAVFGGGPGRCGVRADGAGLAGITRRGDFDSAVVGATMTQPIAAAGYFPAVLDEALSRALAEPAQLSAVDSQTIGSSLAIFRERVRIMRELAAVQNPIVAHALNSIDLGLIGLAKVMDGAYGG